MPAGRPPSSIFPAADPRRSALRLCGLVVREVARPHRGRRNTARIWIRQKPQMASKKLATPSPATRQRLPCMSGAGDLRSGARPGRSPGSYGWPTSPGERSRSQGRRCQFIAHEEPQLMADESAAFPARCPDPPAQGSHTRPSRNGGTRQRPADRRNPGSRGRPGSPRRDQQHSCQERIGRPVAASLRTSPGFSPTLTPSVTKNAHFTSPSPAVRPDGPRRRWVSSRAGRVTGLSGR
jgi:hypothetical protein